MPFRQGTLSFRRFVIADALSDAFQRTATVALRRFSYRPIDAARGEREAFGWVNPRRPLATSWTWEDMVDGNLVFLAVRRDRKSFNQVIYRARREDLFDRVKKEKGMTRLSRQHRIALEEQLTIEMLNEVTPVSAFTELVWDLNTNEVFVGATGKALCERVADLFHGTFEARLAPQFPALIGHAWMAQGGLEENFELANAAAAGKG